MTEKDKKIIEDSEREGIPIFVLTAKDKLAIPTIMDYVKRCSSENCNADHVDAAAERVDDFFQYWQNNPGKVKLPD